MRADYKVVLDACVLAPASLCDLFLRLAETPRLYVPLWSADILAETKRTQIGKLGWPEDLATHWQDEVEKHFPEAMVEGYEPLISLCQNHEKDRHVLAAAIKAQAETIVTANIRDFPPDALKPWGITVTHPAEYLITLYSIDPGLVVAKLDDFSAARKVSREVLLSKLAKSVPGFSRYVADALNLSLPNYPVGG